MQRQILAGATLAAALFAVPTVAVHAEDFAATLSGLNEIGGLGAGETGAINSPAAGTVKLVLDEKAQTLSYTLTYSGFPATETVTQSHIHFGKARVAGGVIVFFCSSLASPPPGTPTCPATAGSVSGVLTPASVVGPAAQHISAGDFAGLVTALTSDTAYANIHTTSLPAGEIRGQVRRAHREDD
jgi:CHRD domain